MTSASPERLLRKVRIARRVLLWSLLAAVTLVVAAVVRGGDGLAVAAKLACLWAAGSAGAVMLLNLGALRAWRRGRHKRATD